MAKVKYRFNAHTLSYDKIVISFKTRVKRFLAVSSTTLATSILIAFGILQFYESPRMRILHKENERLLTQYELMYKDLGTIEKVLDEIEQRDNNLYRVIFESDPIPSTIRKAGFGGVNRYSKLESFDNSDLVIKTAEKIDILSKEAYIQAKSYDDVMKMAMNKEELVAGMPAIMPISNKSLKSTASGWGYRIHPIYKIKQFHYGMDFTANIGTPIYATGDGVVKDVQSIGGGFGKFVIIDHGFGYETLYGHMSDFKVKKGDKVKRGSVIGLVGNSGTSTGPHVHYEVHKNGEPVNPQYYYFKDLNAQEYEKMVKISSNIGQTFD
ncbi:peptidase, family M23 [Aquipluma nitroreducens]|uniref:Peptidase, family M23 n=1 Tax=Aquipluma nitroreducens TaxID=2010828 RepID=A0A5K7SCM3_9BACT|nr:M23 family metallopeptidase [Aquipluma nitroreducens]BBE19219.1 peptidase, family M23 [Aquipluma nitroreducens]